MKEGTRKKSELLKKLHPDVTKVVWKFNRWHHEVNYRPFRNNRLIRADNVTIPEGTNEYGMVLTRKEDSPGRES